MRSVTELALPFNYNVESENEENPCGFRRALEIDSAGSSQLYGC